MIKNILVLLVFTLSNIIADGLQGTIKDHSSQNPVQGAIIWLEGTNYIDTTDASGNYQIPNIPTGTYTVIIQHANFVQLVYSDFLIDKTVDVNNQMKETPTDFNLDQNYPNPFNPTTQISYQVPISSDISIKVYDSLGKFITKLVDGYQNEGYYSVTWNGKDNFGAQVPSGVYFYQFTAGKYSISKKMILMK